MSDISLDLSGVIALLIFMFSAAGFGLAGLIALIIAIAIGSEPGRRIVRTKAFGFFIAAVVLALFDLVGFIVMMYTVDSNPHRINTLLDTAALGWLPLQLAIWVIGAILFNRIRLRS
ncbi:MAG: hypothetical protein ABI999_13515 [Acidobacteriota bacterium]